MQVLNEVKVCTTCRKHFTKCKCSTETPEWKSPSGIARVDKGPSGIVRVDKGPSGIARVDTPEWKSSSGIARVDAPDWKGPGGTSRTVCHEAEINSVDSNKRSTPSLDIPDMLDGYA